MMKYLIAIKAIKYCHLTNEYLIASGEKVNLYDTNLKKIWEYEESIFYAILFSNFYLFQNKNGMEVKYFNLENKNFDVQMLDIDGEFNKYYLLFNSKVENRIFILNESRGVSEFNNNLIFEKHCEIGRYNQFITSETYLKIFGTNIWYNTLVDNIELWQLDVSLWRNWCSNEELRQLDPNTRIVEASEQHVIIATTYGTGCIDTQNGKLVWFREKINPKKSRTAFIQLHEGIFKEINPLNGEAIYEIDLTESFTKNGYLHWKSSSNCELLDDRLVAFTITTFHSILVVFDKFTAEIVWYHLFQDENGFKISLPSDNLQVHKNRIYVIDSTETLHIFERDNQLDT